MNKNVTLWVIRERVAIYQHILRDYKSYRKHCLNFHMVLKGCVSLLYALAVASMLLL